MRTLLILAAAVLCCTSKVCATEPNPQIILLGDRLKTCPWSSGITLARALVSLGGLRNTHISLVRQSSVEKVDAMKQLERQLEPWDIIIADRPATQVILLSDQPRRSFWFEG